MNGGEVYVLQSGGWNGPLDSDGEIIINGGSLVAVGSSSMPEIPSSSSKQCVIMTEIDSKSGDISLRSSGGDDSILSFQISSVFGVNVAYSLVSFSSSSIQMCTSYDIIVGGSKESVTTSGSSTVTTNVKSGRGGKRNDNEGEKCKKGLSTGGIVGIVIACAVVVALIIVLLVYFLVIRKRKSNNLSKGEVIDDLE